MEVHAFVQHDSVRAWLVTGFPFEFAWYRPGLPTARRTIMQCGRSRYYVCREAAFALLRDSGRFDPRRHESELVLRLPLEPYGVFGARGMVKRNDGMYVWMATGIRDTVLADAEGHSALRRVYTLVFRALNSLQYCQWIQGEGLVRYTYHHNGSPADCDIRLVHGFSMEQKEPK